MKNSFCGQDRESLPAECVDISMTDGCCFALHRQWLERGFRFREDYFMYFEDVELFLRLKRAGARFRYNAKAVLYHEEYGSTGGPQKPSPLREYYFYRNRLMLASEIHGRPVRYRVMYRILRLAFQKRKLYRDAGDRPCQKAITSAIFDYWRGVKGYKDPRSFLP